jgi:predicted nuclease of predicted toxin-antitoxin system
MRLLVDAQLPRRLATALAELGHDVLHTSELPAGNRTPDGDVRRIADEERRIVVTKDRDFVDSHVLTGSPRQLLVVATGNIANDELLALFLTTIHTLDQAFESNYLVELTREAIVIHS